MFERFGVLMHIFKFRSQGQIHIHQAIPIRTGHGGKQAAQAHKMMIIWPDFAQFGQRQVRLPVVRVAGQARLVFTLGFLQPARKGQ